MAANSRDTTRCYVSTEGNIPEKKIDSNLVKLADLSFLIRKFKKLSRMNLENEEDVR